MIKRVALFFFLIVFLVFAFGWLKIQNTLPHYQGTKLLSGLEDKVKIYFDGFGVPHIYANSEADAYFTLGYVHAQERLYQMELIRRVCEGRLAETLGDELIQVDKYFKTLGINRHAQKLQKEFFNSNAEPYQKAANAYLNGLNTFIENGPTPIEFTILRLRKKPFDKTDLLQVAGYMALGFAGGIEEDLLVQQLSNKLSKEYIADLAIDWVNGTERIASHPLPDSLLQEFTDLQLSMRDFLPVPMFIGSNAWVVGSELSESGNAVLCNDTHIGFRQPAVWFEAHLNYPGQNFFGKFLAGFPFAPIGNNEFTAIGLTMLENDDTNLHYETINEAGDRYLLDGKWEAVSRLVDTIFVKNGEPVPFEILETNNGPIISDLELLPATNSNKAISLWWLYLKQPGNFLKAAYNWSHAKKMEDVQKAASMVGAPGLNVMYADKDQNIAWFATAKLPVFESGNSKFVMKSSDAPTLYLSFSQNPHSINPTEGYVYSANNQPGPFEGFFHPGYYLPEDRARRITELLSDQDSWSLEDLQALQFDNTSSTYTSLIEVLDEENVSSELIDVLKKWDGQHSLSSIGATVYNYLIAFILEKSFKDEMKEDAFSSFLNTHLMKRTIHDFIQNKNSKWWDDVSTSELENRKQILQAALDETKQKLTKWLGEDYSTWTWERLHTISHKHTFDAIPALRKHFNVGPAPSPGGNMVINNTGFRFDTDSLLEVTMGPAMRTIVHFSDPMEVYSILPSGQSGHFLSPHYGDQFELFNSGKYRRIHMNLDSVKVHAKSKLVLKP